MTRDDRTIETDGGASLGPLERVRALAELLASLDRRVVEAFETIGRVGTASDGLERLTEEGSDLVDDLRGRLDRLETRLHADLDEIKAAVMDKIEGFDTAELSERLNETDRAVHNIERAVTRLDSLVEGVVDSVPDFITRRVRSRASAEDPRLPITEEAEEPVEPAG